MQVHDDAGYDNHFGFGKWKLTKGNLVVAKGGSKESVWCLLTRRWEAAMGREGGVVSAVGGGGLVSTGDGGLAEEEDRLVTLGSRGGMGGDFVEADTEITKFPKFAMGNN